MVVIGYLFGLSVNYYETQLIMSNDFSFLAFSQSYITYDIILTVVAGLFIAGALYLNY